MRPREKDIIAGQLLGAFDTGNQIDLPSASQPDFTLKNGYEIGANVHARRLARGERAAGRKIGFTNRTIWDIYDVHAPIWGWMYETTTNPIPASGKILLPNLPECRIEPEIAFHFRATRCAMISDVELADCIDTVAHGIEIVWSAYPGWRFAAADTAAAFGMHGAFWYGAPQPAAPFLKEAGRVLANLTLTLEGPSDTQNGKGTDVLDGPFQALRHLILETQAAPIAPGEWVTTGTLVDARPAAPGETWKTTIGNNLLPGLEITFHPAS